MIVFYYHLASIPYHLARVCVDRSRRVLTEHEDYAEADDVLNKGEAIFRHRLTPFHLWLGDNQRNQGISFCQQLKYEACLAKAQETLTIYEKSFGTHYDHYPTALIAKKLSLSHLGQVREGEQALRKARKRCWMLDAS